MKKFLVIFFAVVLVVAYTVPVMAKVHVGGIVFTDFWYQDQDKENSAGYNPAVAGSGSDQAFTRIQVPNITRFNGKWTNDAGNVGMFIEFGIDGNGINERGLVTRKAFGWWQINPMVRLVVGMDDTGFSPMNPSQMIGLEGGRLNVIGVGFGNLYPGRVPQIRLDFKPSKTMRFRIGIADNSWDLGADGTSCAAYNDPVFPAAVNKAVQDETKMPRFDVSAVLSFGPLTIYPGFMYAKKTWDDVASGSDDEVKTYALSLGAKFAAGPFTFRAEYNTGENWGNQDFLGIGVEQAGNQVGAALLYIDGAGNRKVEDSDMDAWWIDVSFKVAPATIHLIYGQQTYENSIGGGFVAGGVKTNLEQTVKMYGISVPIPVAKVFIIRPELMFYDLDEWEIENAVDRDRGKYMILGVQFQIVF
jgi:hypothetical protein